MASWTWALGLANVTAMYLALHRHRTWAAALSLVLQVPWTAYDIATGQPGFLLITAGSVVTCAPVLWHRALREQALARKCRLLPGRPGPLRAVPAELLVRLVSAVKDLRSHEDE